MLIKRTLFVLALPGLVLGLAAGCGKKTDAKQGPAGRPPTQVVAVEARLQPVAETLALVGSVLANEMVQLKSEVEGKVELIKFNEGQAVRQGELLILLDESRWSNEVVEAKANFEMTATTYERNKQLSQERLISPQEFDQSATAFEATRALLAVRERRLKDARIVAPFDGVVGARTISPGQVIEKNTVMTWLVDIDPVKVEVNVPERFLSQLKLDQQIEILVSAYPERTFRGEVFFIAPFVDPATRTALVKARIPNPDGALKPGMFANLELTLTVRDKAVVIPEVALSRVMENNQANIFVVDSNQQAQLRMVTLGVRMPNQVEITKGLAEGEVVVVEGTQKIGPGAKVIVAAPEHADAYRPQLTRHGTNEASRPQ